MPVPKGDISTTQPSSQGMGIVVEVGWVSVRVSDVDGYKGMVFSPQQGSCACELKPDKIQRGGGGRHKAHA